MVKHSYRRKYRINKMRQVLPGKNFDNKSIKSDYNGSYIIAHNLYQENTERLHRVLSKKIYATKDDMYSEVRGALRAFEVVGIVNPNSSEFKERSSKVTELGITIRKGLKDKAFQIEDLKNKFERQNDNIETFDGRQVPNFMPQMHRTVDSETENVEARGVGRRLKEMSEVGVSHASNLGRIPAVIASQKRSIKRASEYNSNSTVDFRVKQKRDKLAKNQAGSVEAGVDTVNMAIDEEL